MAWNRKTAWIASRTGLLPRNEKLTLEMPPETSAPGRFSLIQRVASMKSWPYVACSSMPVATANTLGSKMMSLGREADLVGQDPVGPLADRLAALEVVGLAVLVEGHHDHGRAVLAAQPGLLDELLLALLHRDRVDDRLALEALQAGLDDLPLGGVDHHRHPADVGLARDQLEEPVHRGDAVDHALVHVDVDDLRAVVDLLGGHRQRGVVVAVLDQLAEPGRAGDVGALADVDEQAVGVDRERLEAGEPHRGGRLGRHPRLGALDRGRDRRDVLRGGAAAAAEQVDQRRDAANSPSTAAIWSGVSSYSPNSLGSPALGWAETKQSAIRASSAT